MAEQCEAVWVRKYVGTDGDLHEQQVRCTYVAGHDRVTHSWNTLHLQDEVEREAYERTKTGIGCDDETPNDVQTLLDNITAGKADPYLEAVLAVAHNRKRALRGVRGFGRL